MDLLTVRLRGIRHEAEGILSFELCPQEAGELPAFTAGAHVDVHLAPGLVRSYSLYNSPQERGRYCIAVNLDRASRGGSRRMHEDLRAGQALTISAPRNNFPLEEGAAHSVLVAGGIGVTPLLAMVRRLRGLGRSWELYYCARTRRHAAFLDELRAQAQQGPGGRLHLHFDAEAGGVLDLQAVVRAAAPSTHFYCCGPLPMLQAFEQATAGLPATQVHVEYFSAREAPATGGGFEVELARSGKVLSVPAGKSILEVLLEAGVEVPYSCMQGVCMSCETRVLAGEPDHRDMVLSPQEQASNRTMMVCCSGAKSARLVLDR